MYRVIDDYKEAYLKFFMFLLSIFLLQTFSKIKRIIINQLAIDIIQFVY